jgi:hypothetical protein
MTSPTPSPENNGSANSGFPATGSVNGPYGSAAGPYGAGGGPYGSANAAYGSPAPAPEYGGASQAPQFSASPQTPGQGQEPPKRSKTLWWVLGGCGCLALLAIAAVIIVIVVLVNNADVRDEPAPTTVSASSDDDTSDQPSDSATPSDHTVDATPDDDSSADADDSGDSAADGTDVDPDDKDGALADAKTQSDILYSSKKGIHDTLVFEGYSDETATYAVDHLDADWNKNALEKAKLYEETGGMSDDEIHEQLTSEYGEQFTKEQADYAIKHLHD